MDFKSQPPKPKSNRHLIIIFIIIFTEVMGFSMVLPVIPFLGLSLGLNPLEIGLIMSVFSFSQLIASPITGKLSDRFGRKPTLLVSQTSTLIGFLLLASANSVWLLIAARLVDGLLGSNMTVSQAYISDVTSPQDRTKIYGYSSAVFGAGLIFGPVIGGTLSAIDYSIPMLVAALISLISIIFVILFLPESLILKKEKIKIKFNDIVPIDEAKRFFKDSSIRKALLLLFIYNLGFMLFISSFPLFAERQIHVTAQEVGFLMAWIGILRVIFQSLLITPLQKKFGEDSALSMGIISMIFTMTILVFITDYIFAFIPFIFIAFGTGVSRPIFTSKLTRSVIKEDTGSVLGVNNSLTSIVQIISPILGGALIQYLPSFFLPALSTIFFVILFILWINGSKIILKY